MGIKEQLGKLKDNWLIIALVFVLIIALSGIGNVFSGFSNMGSFSKTSGMMYDSYSESARYAPSTGGGGFAPEVEQRVILKTATLSSEVKRGTFKDAEDNFKSVITASDSFLLNENTNDYDSGWKSYNSGSYTIKVPTTKYDSVLLQLKEIGTVKSFRENSVDVTGNYVDMEVQLANEKARLERYKKMYEETTIIADKIDLNDRIFNQENTIAYLERAIRNVDQKVDYSQVQFSISEKRSEYADIAFAKFSQLVEAFVGSFNALLYLLTMALPWYVAWRLYTLIRNKFKK
ncbi:MAG: DUF4349 domain-containing protein [archaeon]